MSDGDADDAMIAETVAHADGEDVPAGMLRHLRNLGLGVAARGQVELVGLLRELGDARERKVRYGIQFGFLLEEAEEVFLRLEALFGAGTLALLGVHGGALLIFGG